MPSLLLQPLLKRFKFDDTCGVNNLHGLPGLIAGLGGIVVAYMADDDKYGPRYGAEKNLPSLLCCFFAVCGFYESFIVALIRHTFMLYFVVITLYNLVIIRVTS